MDINTSVVIVFGLIISALLLFIILKQRTAPETDDENSIILDQLERLTRTMDERLRSSQTDLHQALRHQATDAQKLIADITRELTEVKESNKQVFSITEQLQNLEKVLKHQKQRGNLGEASLELILANILPPTAFKMQYEFPGGETVDAVIITKDGTIPIDAKFSLDNYQRLINAIDEGQRADLEKAFKNDLKLRIDECAKYV